MYLIKKNETKPKNLIFAYQDKYNVRRQLYGFKSLRTKKFSCFAGLLK